MHRRVRKPRTQSVRRSALAFGFIVVVISAAGCNGPPRHTITGAEAISHLDGYLEGAVKAASPTVKVTRVRAEATYTGGCSKSPIGDDFSGQVQATVTYEISKLSDHVAADYLDSLAQLWEKTWGSVEHSTGHVGIRIGHDGFVLYANFEPANHLVKISGNSGCIWANGTPGPEGNP